MREESGQSVTLLYSKMKEDVINSTFKEWKSMLIDYYANGYDQTGGKMDKAYRDLVELGVDPEYLLDIDFEIRDKIWGDDC